METKTFTQNNRTFLAIEVPDGAINFSYDKYRNLISADLLLVAKDKEQDWFTENLPYGEYKILSLLSDATEEQCKEMVEAKELYNVFKKADIMYYMNYNSVVNISNIGNSKWEFTSAKASLTSRLTSLGMDTNKNILLIEKI